MQVLAPILRYIHQEGHIDPRRNKEMEVLFNVPQVNVDGIKRVSSGPKIDTPDFSEILGARFNVQVENSEAAKSVFENGGVEATTYVSKKDQQYKDAMGFIKLFENSFSNINQSAKHLISLEKILGWAKNNSPKLEAIVYKNRKTYLANINKEISHMKGLLKNYDNSSKNPFADGVKNDHGGIEYTVLSIEKNVKKISDSISNNKKLPTSEVKEGPYGPDVAPMIIPGGVDYLEGICSTSTHIIENMEGWVKIWYNGK